MLQEKKQVVHQIQHEDIDAISFIKTGSTFFY